MRIISGDLKGRKITSPVSSATRPTKDRIRGSVFNIIAPNVQGARVLDLFCGSGAYGFEALSRGADHCVFVDNSPECCLSVRKTIKDLSLDPRCTSICMEANEYFVNLSGEAKKFDLVFADPPYNREISKNILLKANQYDILNDLGVLVLEHSCLERLPSREGNVSICKQKTYKKISISIFQRS